MAKVTKLTIDSTKISADLTDYPVYVNLADMNTDFWSTVANGGGDIRVFKSDGTTELPREVVSCDTTAETGELHFKYSGTLSSTTDTVVEIHADGTSSDYATTATYGAENVWTNYSAVWHMDSTTDSTGNGYTLTAKGGVTAGSATGKLGNATTFDGTDDYLSATAVDYSNSDFTAQMWIKTTDTDRNEIFSIGDDIGKWWVVNTATDNQSIGAFIDDGSSGVAINSTDSATINNGNWQSVCVTYDRDNVMTSYVAGSQELTSSSISSIGDIYSTGNTVIGSNAGSLDRWFDGDMDEVRLRPDILSANWITTEYNNQSSPSTFYTAENIGVSFSIAETLSLTESESAIRARNFTVNESLTLSETVNAILTKIFSVAESISLSETVTNIRSRLFNITESLTLSETASARKLWNNLTKNLATWTEKAKNSTTWTNKNK